MNLIMLMLTIGSTELLARVFSKETPTGETLFGIVLYPKDWSQFAAYYRKVMDKMATEGSSVAYDPMLGWTVAPSRTDKTGLYSTSARAAQSSSRHVVRRFKSKAVQRFKNTRIHLYCLDRV
jgi:hypothetical protein